MAQDGLNPITSSVSPGSASSPTSLQHWLGQSLLSVCYLTVFSAPRSVSPASKTLGIGKVSVMVGVHKVKGNQGHTTSSQLLVALSLMLCIGNYSCMSPRPPAPPTTTSHHQWQSSPQPTTIPPPCKTCAAVSETQGSCPRHPPLSWGPFLVVSSLLSSKISLLDIPCSLSSETLSQAFWEPSS